MEAKEFGTRLRELRLRAGLSQRALADKVGVDFSYLSKIENGVIPPPSEKVILKLAEVLQADADELMTSAGKIPADIAQILKDREALKVLRARQSRERIGTKREGSSIIKDLVGYKGFARVAIAVTLVIAVATSLWFSSPLPAKALEVSFPSLPSGTLGNSHSFSITVDITSAELVPIQSINLEIYNVNSPTTIVTANNLPLTKGASKSYSNTDTGGGGTVSVTASSANDNWAYLLGTGYANWQGTGYSFGPTFGYGYATGAAQMTYTGTWVSPSGWPSGEYKAKVSIVATSSTLSQTFIKNSSSFTLAAPTNGGAGGGFAGPVVSGGVTFVSAVVTSNGVFTESVTVASQDNNVKLSVGLNTVGKTQDGLAISTISITPMTTTPTPPADASTIGLTYDFGPEGATFAPPITLTFTYDETKIPTNVAETDLKIAYFDKTANPPQWVELSPVTIDPLTNKISAPVSHFTTFSVIAHTRPAAFSLSALSISPAEVNIGEFVTIKATVTNTGDFTGSYQTILKIDNVSVEAKQITLTARTSQTVTFSTTRNAAGTYSVSIGGLSGTFTVKAPPAPPAAPPPAKPAAFSLSALSISPAEVNTGERAIISITVANTGDLSGNYQATLKINNIAVETKEVTLAGGTSQTVTFSATRETAGTYSVSVGGLSGTFTVKAPPVTPPVIPPAKPVNWGLIGGIIAAVIVVGIVAWLVLRRRTAW